MGKIEKITLFPYFIIITFTKVPVCGITRSIFLSRKKTDFVKVEETSPSQHEETNQSNQQSRLLTNPWTSEKTLHNLGQSIQSFCLETDPITALTLELSHNRETTLTTKTFSHPNLTDDSNSLLHEKNPPNSVLTSYSKSTPNVFNHIEYEDDFFTQIKSNKTKNNFEDNHSKNGSAIKEQPSQHTDSEKVIINGKHSQQADVALTVSESQSSDPECGCIVWCCGSPCCKPLASSSMAQLLRSATKFSTIYRHIPYL